MSRVFMSCDIVHAWPVAAPAPQEAQKVRKQRREQAKGWRDVVSKDMGPVFAGAAASSAGVPAALGHAAAAAADGSKKHKVPAKVPKELDFTNVLPFVPPKAHLYEDSIEKRVRLFMSVNGRRASSGGKVDLQPLDQLLRRLLVTAWSWHRDATGEESPWPEFKLG